MCYLWFYLCVISGSTYVLSLVLLMCYLWFYLCVISGSTYVLSLALLMCYLWFYLCVISGSTYVLSLALLMCYLWLYFCVISGSIYVLSLVLLMCYLWLCLCVISGSTYVLFLVLLPSSNLLNIFLFNHFITFPNKYIYVLPSQSPGYLCGTFGRSKEDEDKEVKHQWTKVIVHTSTVIDQRSTYSV